MTTEISKQLPRRRKARAIRRSVVAFALASFIAAWGLIYGQSAHTAATPTSTKSHALGTIAPSPSSVVTRQS